MNERLGCAGGYHDDYEYEKEDQQRQDSQPDDILWYRLADPDYIPEEEDGPEGGLEDSQGRPEQVEHQLDHAADDTAQLDAEVQF